MIHSPLVPFLLVTLGFLWLVWLYRLRALPTTPNLKKKCHQMNPRIRTTLFVFSILFLLSASWFWVYACKMCLFNQGSCVNVGVYSVFILLFALQAMWLHQMQKNKRYIVHRCYGQTTKDIVIASILILGSVLYVIVGGIGVFRQFQN
jgi:hypothetical protein